MNPYRRRVLKFLKNALSEIELTENAKVLDFGAGDGWFAKQIAEALPNQRLLALEVQRRESLHYEIQVESPDFIKNVESQSFELVYSIDVLHHCSDPVESLLDLVRVSKRYILIKDHVSLGKLDNFILGVLDEIGNRRFGIPSNYKYQKHWQWKELLLSKGWTWISKQFPCECHKGVLGALTNKLQYIHLYERNH